MRIRRAAIVVLASFPAAAWAASDWAGTPYRVRVVVHGEGPSAGEPELLSRLRRELRDKLLRRGGLALRAEVVAATGDDAPMLLSAADTAPSSELAPVSAGAKGFDKVVYAALRETPSGVFAVAREIDAATLRWGPRREARVGRAEEGSEGLLAATIGSLQPLLRIELDPQDEALVVVTPRAVGLATDGTMLRRLTPDPGEVLVPYTRRVRRDASATAMAPTPWTYLVVEPPAAADVTTDGEAPPAALRARVFSHRRRPFGARRSGSVELLAIAAESDPRLPTTLVLHDQASRDVPLSGYAVLIGAPDDRNPPKLGRTDLAGRIELPPAEGMRLATVRVGEQIVARLPIAPGVDREVSVPLLDERQRLSAEAKISLLRDELMDLVARRTILSLRVAMKLDEAGGEDDAERLLRELEELPGRAQFNQKIDSAQRLYTADHPVLQRRIERQFEGLRAVLGNRLGPREVIDLNAKLRAARQGGTPAAERRAKTSVDPPPAEAAEVASPTPPGDQQQ
jgi:hypothetical protein